MRTTTIDGDSPKVSNGTGDSPEVYDGTGDSSEVFDGTDDSEDLDGSPTTPHDSGESSNTDLVNRTQLSSIYLRYFRLGFVLKFDIVDFQKFKYLLVDFHLVFCEFEMLLFE